MSPSDGLNASNLSSSKEASYEQSRILSSFGPFTASPFSASSGVKLWRRGVTNHRTVGTDSRVGADSRPSTSAMDVAPYFHDPDGDALTYDAVSSIIGVVSVNVMRWARSRPTVNERRVGRSDGTVDGGHRAAGVSSVVGSAR